MLPISTVVRDDAVAASTLDPSMVPPITIIVLLFNNATPTYSLALVKESTFLHDFLIHHTARYQMWECYLYFDRLQSLEG